LLGLWLSLSGEVMLAAPSGWLIKTPCSLPRLLLATPAKPSCPLLLPLPLLLKASCKVAGPAAAPLPPLLLLMLAPGNKLGLGMSQPML
jgi:hypothetical protein